MNNIKSFVSAYYAIGFHFKHKIDVKSVIPLSRLCLQSRDITFSTIVRDKSRLTITLEKEDGSSVIASCKVGDTLRDIIASHKKEVGEDYGVCDGSVACSTCHVIFNKTDFDKLPKYISDEESDVLDLAPNYTSTSRLACAINMTSDLDGIKVKIPDVRYDARKLMPSDD